jgi:TonB-linked SusC/RagA family outer membrane protein
MKNRTHPWGIFDYSEKFKLQMRLTFFFLFIMIVQVQANSYSQNAKVTLQLEEKSIEEVLKKIETLSEFKFLYNSKEIDFERKISVNYVKEPISRVLRNIFLDTEITFQVVNKQIILKSDPNKVTSYNVEQRNEKIFQQLITGTVTDDNGMPLPGVNITVEGTTIGATTDFDGNYSIEAPSNESVLLFKFLGMKTARKTVGDQTVLNVVMKTDSQSLDEVIVTATGTKKRVEIGNAISQLQVGDDVKERPINNVSDLIQGQASGVQIYNSGGSTGMGSRIRIRGSNSASLSNEPVIYVDGVLINNQSNSISFETGGQSPSRFNDINPEDIESIEIIKGPSAATLYGSIAANGVILVTTKKGKFGKARWSAYMESGLVQDIGDYPKNYQALDAAGNPGFNFEAAEGEFTPSIINSFQPLNDPDTSPFRTGNSYGVGLSVSGGTEKINYYVSGNFGDNEGVLPVSNIRRTNFRANLGADITDELKINITTGYTNSDLELPLNDNFSLALMSQGLSGNSTRDVNNGWGEFTPEELFTIDTRQRINRYTTGLNTNWTPNDNLTFRLAGGLDFTSRWDSQFFPTGEAPAFLNYDEGAMFSNRFNEFVYTLDAVGSYEANIWKNISSRSSIGFQYLQNLTQGTLASGFQLVAGSKSIAGAAVTESSEQTVESRTVGVFVEEQVGFDEKLYITGALRADRGSAFGASFDAVIYPKVSASWLITKESFFETGDWLNSLRLRGAWGASGVQPGTNDALRFFTPIAATVDGGQNVTGVTFGSVGNADLKPERSSEIELGLDASFFTNRINLELTYFNKETEDALIFRQLPLSLGVGEGRFENLGSVKNTGVEVALDLRILETETTYFNLNFIASFIDNELVRLGDGIQPVIFGVQRHVEGYPLGGYWDEQYTFNDANGDGLIAIDEVQVGDITYLGTPFATTDISVTPELGLFNDRVVFQGLLNYRGGQKLYNNTASWRNGNNNTRELNDPSSSLEGQARAIASKFYGTDAGYIEDASFLRLRELSLTYNFSRELIKNIGFSNLSFTVSGQNLGLWTDYSGLDPEISSAGQNNFVTEEFLSQPPVRSWKARLNLTF